MLQAHITDWGGKPAYTDVQIEGVPARGVIDSGSDITVMGGDMFRYAAMIMRLRKSQFRKPVRVPRAYNVSLDGIMDLDITFNGVTMKTPIYIRATASEQLLLGESVCRQLWIISYHPDVSDRKGKKCHPPPLQKPLDGGEDKKVITGLLQDHHRLEREKQPDKRGPEEQISAEGQEDKCTGMSHTLHQGGIDAMWLLERVPGSFNRAVQYS